MAKDNLLGELRFEVVDEVGRVYTRDPRGTGAVKVDLAIQDEGRTLKAFVQFRDEEEEKVGK